MKYKRNCEKGQYKSNTVKKEKQKRSSAVHGVIVDHGKYGGYVNLPCTEKLSNRSNYAGYETEAKQDSLTLDTAKAFYQIKIKGFKFFGKLQPYFSVIFPF